MSAAHPRRAAGGDCVSRRTTLVRRRPWPIRLRLAKPVSAFNRSSFASRCEHRFPRDLVPRRNRSSASLPLQNLVAVDNTSSGRRGALDNNHTRRLIPFSSAVTGFGRLRSKNFRIISRVPCALKNVQCQGPVFTHLDSSSSRTVLNFWVFLAGF